jgi:apolipoprotein N-acyltransferase
MSPECTRMAATPAAPEAPVLTDQTDQSEQADVTDVMCLRRRLPVWAWGGLAAMASGSLMSACYWPVEAHGLAWVALVPLLVVLPRVSPGTAGLLGLLLGLAFYRIGLAWLFQIHSRLAGISIFVLSAWMGLAFSLARSLMGRRPWAMIWAVPFAFVGQEVLRCEGLPRMRFAFTALGYSQSNNLWFAQIASIGGVYFLAMLILLVNAAIAYALIQRRLRACLPLVAIAGLVIGLGLVAQPRDYSHRTFVPAACVQAESTRLRVYRGLTQAAIEHASRPKLIVLPEHTISDYANKRHPLVMALGEMAHENDAIICVGAHVAATDGSKCDYDNVAMLIGADGSILNEQPKWVPLPFFSDGNPGRTQAITATEYGKIGMYVCYDGLFTDIPRRIVAMGAEILLVPNMDAARWPDQERRQHADMAPFRSIELRRCAVRANSAGVSQIIDASGRVLAHRGSKEGAGAIYAPVYAVSERTLFVRGGYLFAQIIGIAYLTAILLVTGWGWYMAIAARLHRRAEACVPAVRDS